MKFIYVFELLYLLSICAYTPVLGAWPALIPSAIKLGSTIAAVGSAYWYRDQIKDGVMDNIPEACFTHVNVPNYDNLHQEVFGQPLALSIAAPMFAKHVADHSPKRALMFYFHGSSGSGKTHTATRLLNRIYHKFRKNRRSEFVHTFTFTFKEDLNASEARHYKKDIVKKIDQMLSVCPSSAFIFDEVDNFPPSFKLDFLAKYVDYPYLNGVQHNKAIFILLGNSHGTEINTLFHRKTVSDGLSRDQLDYEDFEADVYASIRLRGPLKESLLLEKARIRAIIPFFPLTRFEVKQCVLRAFQELGYNMPMIEPGKAIIDKIVESRKYDDKYDLYSMDGCHSVDSAVEKELSQLERKKKKFKQEL